MAAERAPQRHRSRLAAGIARPGARKQRGVRAEVGSLPTEGPSAAAIEAREAFLHRWDSGRRKRLWRRREELERTDVREARPVIPHAPRPADDMEDELGERDRDRDRDRDRERDPGALPAALGVPPAASAAAKRQSPRVRQLLLYRKSLLSVLDENRKTFQGRAYWAACSAAAPSTHASTTTDPARPHRRAAAPLCVMCSYWGDATCTLCGDAICGLDCLRRHQDSHCEGVR